MIAAQFVFKGFPIKAANALIFLMQVHPGKHKLVVGQTYASSMLKILI
jgi:hypothetical protein